MPPMNHGETDPPGAEATEEEAAKGDAERIADALGTDRAEPLAASEGAETTPPARSDVIHIKRSHFYAMLLPLSFALGIGLGYLLWGQGSVSAGPSRAGNTSSAAGRVEIDPGDDPSLGPSNAPITIVEFSDFNCPFCQRWHNETFQELLNAYPEQIRFVYKDFPVVGGGTVGMSAAQAANCAGEQGAYWEFHAALFSGSQPFNRSGYQAYAAETGIDAEALLACIDSGRHAEEITDDLQYGAGLGITGTPTFFINGIPLVGAQPLLRFIEIINQELG